MRIHNAADLRREGRSWLISGGASSTSTAAAASHRCGGTEGIRHEERVGAGSVHSRPHRRHRSRAGGTHLSHGRRPAGHLHGIVGHQRGRDIGHSRLRMSLHGHVHHMRWKGLPRPTDRRWHETMGWRLTLLMRVQLRSLKRLLLLLSDARLGGKRRRRDDG